jgi:hypothetical protein
MKLLNFDQLTSQAKSTTPDEAKKEIARELKMRRKVFQTRASKEPSKADTYRKQYMATAAIGAILDTMTEANWQRRMTSAYGQSELFPL